MNVLHVTAGQSCLAPASTPGVEPRTPAKFLDATIDDEDLFLGDDVGDEIENDMVDEEEDDDDFDDDYFTSTYRPLSNLPTPPPSRHTSLTHSPQLDQGEALESTLLGPAVHLVNMLPPACSLATPSVPLVQAMLTRAQLPLDTVALAVCILDSLDSRFARTWRATCPLGRPPLRSATLSSAAAKALTTAASAGPAAGKRHTLPSPLTPPPFPDLELPTVDRLLHIDAVFPEVIVLAALVIAAKFTDDGHVSQQSAQVYCAAWGSGPADEAVPSLDGLLHTTSHPGPCALWTGAQLAATERCIMQSLGYRILPLLDADLLADAQADMRRAGTQALRAQRVRAAAAEAAAKVEAVEQLAAMTPPAEAAAVSAAMPPPATLDLEMPTTTAADTEAVHVVGYGERDNAQRWHHASSRSECLVRSAAYDV